MESKLLFKMRKRSLVEVPVKPEHRRTAPEKNIRSAMVVKKKIVLRFRAVNKDIFEAIRSDKKKVETRAATKKYNAIQKGDEIEFVCGRERFKKRVRHATVFPTIRALLKKYAVADIMPLLHTEKELREAYYRYPNYKEKILKFGLIALEFYP